MRLIYGPEVNDQIAFWVGLHIPMVKRRIEQGSAEPFGPSVAFGVVNRDGDLCGGVVFHNYLQDMKCIEVSCAATKDNWLTPSLARTILRYPFTQLGCQRVTAVTPRRGTRVRRFLEGLGFVREGSVRRGFLTDNAIIYGLLSEEWAAHRINRPKERVIGGKVGPVSAASA